MKKINQKEITFIKETHFTPTVFQCDEYKKTPFKDYEEACKIGRSKYGVNVDKLLSKFGTDYDDDYISLGYTATYLFYSFYSQKELMELDPVAGLKWLKDIKYYFGFRKWHEEDVAIEIREAIEVYTGVRKFYKEEDGHMWNRLKEN